MTNYDARNLREGDKVYHEKYGVCEVVGCYSYPGQFWSLAVIDLKTKQGQEFTLRNVENHWDNTRPDVTHVIRLITDAEIAEIESKEALLAENLMQIRALSGDEM